MTVDVPSLDDLQALIADIRADIRAREWQEVDAIALFIDALMSAGTAKIRAAALAGEAAQCRAHWAQLRHRIAHTFPPEWRYPHLDLFVYRVALEAPDPHAAIVLAADNNWSAKELRAWIDAQKHKQPRTAIRLSGLMTWTGGDMTITPTDYDYVLLEEGLEDVPVRALIYTDNSRSSH